MSDPVAGVTPSGAVLIIGAGPAGLAAASALTRRGLAVHLVERSPLLGGKVNSHHDAGFSLEHGVHGWWVNYLNFDRLLRWAGTSPDDVLQPAQGSTLILPDGRRYPLQTLKPELPSPLCVILQFLRAPYLSLLDVIRLLPLAVHVLAFSHEHDYDRYDGFSFQQLMDGCGVSPRVQRLILEPFVLSFHFTTADRVSAACTLSGLQFYVMRDQRCILARWARGLPNDVIFGPIAQALTAQGARISRSTSAVSLAVENGTVSGVRLAGDAMAQAPAAALDVIARVPAGGVPEGSFSETAASSGSLWVGRFGNGVRALSSRCTHEGCAVDWKPEASAFVCPCHGGRFDAEGAVLQGPPKLPLDRLQTREVDAAIEILASPAPPIERYDDVIVAMDLEGAKELVAHSDGLPTDLRHDIGHLDTTPVIVVRLWFDAAMNYEPPIESALTPGFEFVDNFFHLNTFDAAIAQEGHVVEVQAYRAGHLLDASDDAILSLALQDLAVIHPAYAPEHLRHFTVNRHRALFTRYGPGQNVFRPVAGEAPPGLALAGDWTRAPWSAWMMERAVISGLQAANAVLERRQLSPVEILRLSPESLFLRVSRALCLLLRLTVSRRLPMGQPPTDDALSAHLEFDHHLIGWVNMLVAVCNLLPLFAPEFRILSQIWPTPFLAVSVYFLFHTEPDVRYRYGTWLRAWADTPTLQHRFMTAGALVAGVAELATGYLQQTSPPLRTLFPLGLVASGIVFYGHHHGDKAVIHRQHNIMAWLFIVTGLTLLVARFIPSLAPLQYAWPMLYGVLAYVFVTYTEEEVHAHGEVGHDDGDAVHAAIVHRHGEES